MADEAADHIVVDAAADGVIFGRQEAEARALEVGVGEHAAARRFEVVALAIGLVEHLIPDAGGAVAIVEQVGGEVAEDAEHRVAAGRGVGHYLEYVGHGHHIPSVGASPGMPAASGDAVGPVHLPALVPAVAVEAGGVVVGVAGHYDELAYHVGGHVLAVATAIFGHERRAHVEPVEPHLVRVDLLVPESALARARMGAHLCPQQVGGLAEALFVGLVVEVEQELARVDVVDVILGRVVVEDGARGVYHRVGVGVDVVEDVFAAVAFGHFDEREELEPRAVVPAQRCPEVEVGRVGHAFHFRLRHQHRQRFVGSGRVLAGVARRSRAGNREGNQSLRYFAIHDCYVLVFVIIFSNRLASSRFCAS